MLSSERSTGTRIDSIGRNGPFCSQIPPSAWCSTARVVLPKSKRPRSAWGPRNNTSARSSRIRSSTTRAGRPGKSSSRRVNEPAGNVCSCSSASTCGSNAARLRSSAPRCISVSCSRDIRTHNAGGTSTACTRSSSAPSVVESTAAAWVASSESPVPSTATRNRSRGRNSCMGPLSCCGGRGRTPRFRARLRAVDTQKRAGGAISARLRSRSPLRPARGCRVVRRSAP